MKPSCLVPRCANSHPLFLGCWFYRACFSQTISISEPGEIIRIERICACRLLPGGTQGEIHPAVISQDYVPEFPDHFFPGHHSSRHLV